MNNATCEAIKITQIDNCLGYLEDCVSDLDHAIKRLENMTSGYTLGRDEAEPPSPPAPNALVPVAARINGIYTRVSRIVYDANSIADRFQG